eukprot:13784751-Ditylum_brightwellii.AAC.1
MDDKAGGDERRVAHVARALDNDAPSTPKLTEFAEASYKAFENDGRVTDNDEHDLVKNRTVIPPPPLPAAEWLEGKHNLISKTLSSSTQTAVERYDTC